VEQNGNDSIGSKMMLVKMTLSNELQVEFIKLLHKQNQLLSHILIYEKMHKVYDPIVLPLSLHGETFHLKEILTTTDQCQNVMS
jgi:hypothetical protein